MIKGTSIQVKIYLNILHDCKSKTAIISYLIKTVLLFDMIYYNNQQNI